MEIKIKTNKIIAIICYAIASLLLMISLVTAIVGYYTTDFTSVLFRGIKIRDIIIPLIVVSSVFVGIGSLSLLVGCIKSQWREENE